MKTLSIRTLLGRLIWLSMLPLLGLGLYLAAVHVGTLRQELLLDARHRALNATTLIDSYVASQIAGLGTLTHSRLLGESPPQLAPFYSVAQGFRESFGVHVIVADHRLQMLLNTRVPFGTPLPALPKRRDGGFGAAPAALASGKAAVGDIVIGPVANQLLVAIAVPVPREDRPPLLLLTTMETAQIAAQLEKVSLPDGWRLSVLDGKGGVIARHSRVAPASGDVERFSHPVAATGGRWQVVMEIERAILQAPLYNAMAAMAAGLLAALLVSYFFGRIAGRSIVGALSSLARTGTSKATPAALRITEVEAIRAQLTASAESLHASEARYEELFAANPQPMWFYDLETLRFLAVNAAAIQHYGYSEAEFLAMTIADIRPPEDVPRLQENVVRIREAAGTGTSTGTDHAGVWRHRRKDGSIISVEITSHVLDYDGRRAEVVLASDISERLRAEARVNEYVLRLERAMTGTAEAIAQIMDLRDPYTAGHERRVGEVAAAIAREMGLSEHVQRGLQVAGDLHDLGKITVPAEILAKPVRLSPSEFELIKQHPENGYQVLKGIDFPWPVAEVARQHHERIDGSGYPRGLKGDDILLEARILAVADVLEAMSSHRPYRPGLGLDKALAEIESQSGRCYDAAVVEACLRMFREKGYRMPQ